ncbi:MAG: glycoside hydrolase family 15 protein [Chloroflexota bacterium]
MGDLYAYSIDTMLRNQSASGAYIASPAFSQYGYCWLRDGSFTAYAMDRAGRYDSTKAFLRWVNRTIQQHAYKVDAVLKKDLSELGENDYLHCRYTVDGAEVEELWTNFQLDGYGTWLWAVAEHTKMVGDDALLRELLPGIALTLRYLVHLWQRPNYDLWEEHLDKVHTSTLAALYGGMRALLDLPAPELDPFRPLMAALAREIKNFVLENCVSDGHLVKYIGTDAVDASLVSVCTPYRLLDPSDPVMVATIEKIERDLVHDGGTHRYMLDTYYGGGEWTLLSAWLGWYFAEVGNSERAREYLQWVARQADEKDDLPEQATGHLLFPERYAEWEKLWGQVAKPLVWSHAMYLLLGIVLGETGSQVETETLHDKERK